MFRIPKTSVRKTNFTDPCFKRIWQREDLRNGNGSLIRNSNYGNHNKVKGIWSNDTLKKVFYDDIEWYEGEFSMEFFKTW